MGEWRYYAKRAGSGLWLDNDVQLADVSLDWAMSAPASGDALLPAGLGNPIASDGRPVFGKWDTILLAEEDSNLAWAGICNSAAPDADGQKVEFIGPTGWLQRVPYNAVYRVWATDPFDVVRELVRHSSSYSPHIEYTVSQAKSGFRVGDEQPPREPKAPPRKKGQSKSEWEGSARYRAYKKDQTAWNKQYGNKEQFTIAWWESPYIGEEIDTLAKEVGFDYRERVRWVNKTNKTFEFIIDLYESLSNRRNDIQLVDGVNIAKPLELKEAEDVFANHVIGLGAGEGRDMVRTVQGGDDGRLYQAEFVSYKGVKNKTRLAALARADLKRFSNVGVEVDVVVAWDVSGFSSLSSLRAGDEVQVISHNTQPPVDTWRRVASITRNPVESVVTLALEQIA